MSTLIGLPSAWRKDLLPAHFDGKLFRVDTGTRESGRRIVTHEFPKKEQPYSEDMGRHAVAFTVRGYCISYPNETPGAASLYLLDYRIARDALQLRLETGGPGVLQLPLLDPMRVVCQRYRLTEEDKLGGYCTFDMQFVEAGVQPFAAQIDTQSNLTAQSNSLKEIVAQTWAAQRARSNAAPAITVLNDKTGKPPRPETFSRYNGPTTAPVYLKMWNRTSSLTLTPGP
jgi:prophage DNA circulation protein